jgi:nitrile hydratase
VNGIYDLGGMDGFKLPQRDQGRVLKEEWERQVWGLLLGSNIPGVGANIQDIPPALYLSMPYYARWLYAREQSLLASGLVTEEELRNPDGPITMPTIPNFQPASPEEAVARLKQDASSQQKATMKPLFSVGQTVTVKNEHPAWSTRVPRYVRGRRGVVQKDHGVYPFRDAVPNYAQRRLQHLYTLRFTGRDLWGCRGHLKDRIFVELWDDHLTH